MVKPGINSEDGDAPLDAALVYGLHPSEFAS